jgi:hypothetical protein
MLPLVQPPSWTTNTYWLSITIYSTYLLLPSISGGCIFHPQPDDMPCCGDRGTHIWTYEGDSSRSWRRLYNKELHSFYTSPNIMKVIKSMKMRWVGNTACMWKMRCIQKFGQNTLSEETTWKTFRFHRRWGTGLAEWLLTSQGLCSMGSVSYLIWELTEYMLYFFIKRAVIAQSV